MGSRVTEGESFITSTGDTAASPKLSGTPHAVVSYASPGQERSRSRRRGRIQHVESWRTKQPLRNFFEASASLQGWTLLFGSGFSRRIKAFLDRAPDAFGVAEQPEYAGPDGFASGECSVLYASLGYR